MQRNIVLGSGKGLEVGDAFLEGRLLLCRRNGLPRINGSYKLNFATKPFKLPIDWIILKGLYVNCQFYKI